MLPFKEIRAKAKVNQKDENNNTVN